MIRPLPINHRPIAINMQCNKIPFIDMNFFWGAFLLRQHFDREHFDGEHFFLGSILFWGAFFGEHLDLYPK